MKKEGLTYLRGRLHSFNDKPSLIWMDFAKMWHRNGKLHRECGPAIIYYNPIGRQVRSMWARHGKIHREDGPAIEWTNGEVSWALNDIIYTEDEFKMMLLYKRIVKLTRK